VQAGECEDEASRFAGSQKEVSTLARTSKNILFNDTNKVSLKLIFCLSL
jgi:hypothetical protein